MYQKFSEQASIFLHKLDLLNIDAIVTTPLVKNYLTSVLLQKKYYVKIYAFVLQNIVEASNKNKQDISLLDFGCGNGLLAMFAKHCGFGKVYGCDFNSDFVEASKQLSQAINIEIDGWVVSNEDDLLNTCNHLKLDAIVGTDVIEHIYNLDVFYSNIRLLNPNMITGFTTASVYENYFKRSSLYKLMYRDENIDSNAFHATSKDEYAGMAYLEIRKKLIAKDFPSLQNNTVLQLAQATRGLRKDDIKIFVEKYLENGIITDALPNNKHNTCDPITGNFTERILTLGEYKLLHNKNHFTMKVFAGFYSADENSVKGLLQKSVNIFIKIFGNGYVSRTVSPLILLVGVPKTSK
jgi:2-polyprenyl-3-methyl-5-hydroxy-6-metoxy-1,4-benzoquinol methylase